MGRWKLLLLTGVAVPLMLAAGLAADGPPSETCKVARLQAAAGNAKAAGPVALSRAEAVGLYLCLFSEMQGGYALSGNQFAAAYVDWDVENAQPFVSAAHGGRHVNVYANDAAAGFGQLEESGRLPPGAVLAMDSFTVTADGRAAPGPLFLMEKVPAGGDVAEPAWRYGLIEPDGRVAGPAETARCQQCHRERAAAHDSLPPVPEEFRID